ncbi:MAG TPA: hypothetical protein VJV79_25295 [Polyangiaceae bacterium]|nr:hypothetical protein [Polyangiaceae bacterium]
MIVPFALRHQSGVKAWNRAGLLVFGSFVQFFWGSAAQAADRVALAYGAAPGCPSEADFKAAVEGRGGHFEGPSGAGSAWALRVSIVQETVGFRGTLQSTNEDATSAVREVRGATCEDIVDALAVVSATALNPQVESNSSANSNAKSASAQQPPAPANAVVGATPEPAPQTTAFSHGRLRATQEVVNATIPVQAGTLRFDYARAVTAFAGAQFGTVPDTVMPRYDLSLSAAALVTTPGGKTYLHGLVPRLRFSYLGQATYKTDDTSTALNGFAFALGACWAPIYDTGGWVALLCGEYGAGLMNVRTRDAQGHEVQNNTQALGFAGLGIESQYNLGSLVQIGAKLGVDFLVDSITAERADGSRIFESSNFAGYGMLGLGVHF